MVVLGPVIVLAAGEVLADADGIHIDLASGGDRISRFNLQCKHRSPWLECLELFTRTHRRKRQPARCLFQSAGTINLPLLWDSSTGR